MGRRAQTRQADRRAGRVCVCETECRCGKAKKRAVLANRKLMGHVDPDTGGVVANRKAKPRGPAPAPKREFHGATCLFDRIAEACGDSRQTSSVRRPASPTPPRPSPAA